MLKESGSPYEHKKITSGYEVRFRVNGCGSSPYPKTPSTKGECERFMRYSIAKFETKADVKPWLEKPKDMRRLSESVVLGSAHIRQPFHDERRQHIDLTEGTRP